MEALPKQIRSSNIELCRLASILLVMLVHTTSLSLGDNVSFGANLLKGFSIIGVNVFVLITGYFSATPKKSNLINLLFICLFWMLVKVFCYHAFEQPITIKDLFFVTSSNWFIPSYIGLLFLSPVLNAFSNSVTKTTLWKVIIALIIVEVWFDVLPPSPSVGIGSQKGYSILSFSILYLMARAIRLYDLPQWFRNYSFLIYVAISFVLAILAHFTYIKTGNKHLLHCIFAYNNPLVIVSSIAFLMMFKQMDFQSKFVNHIAKSTLAVLLGHLAIFFLYTKQFKFLYDNYTGFTVVLYWTLSIMIVYFSSVAIDQVRLFLYKPLEKLMRNKITKDKFFD